MTEKEKRPLGRQGRSRWRSPSGASRGRREDVLRRCQSSWARKGRVTEGPKAAKSATTKGPSRPRDPEPLDASRPPAPTHPSGKGPTVRAATVRARPLGPHLSLHPRESRLPSPCRGLNSGTRGPRRASAQRLRCGGSSPAWTRTRATRQRPGSPEARNSEQTKRSNSFNFVFQ